MVIDGKVPYARNFPGLKHSFKWKRHGFDHIITFTVTFTEKHFLSGIELFLGLHIWGSILLQWAQISHINIIFIYHWLVLSLEETVRAHYSDSNTWRNAWSRACVYNDELPGSIYATIKLPVSAVFGLRKAKSLVNSDKASFEQRKASNWMTYKPP